MGSQRFRGLEVWWFRVWGLIQGLWLKPLAANLQRAEVLKFLWSGGLVQGLGVGRRLLAVPCGIQAFHPNASRKLPSPPRDDRKSGGVAVLATCRKARHTQTTCPESPISPN